MSDTISLLLPPFLVALCLTGIHALFGLEILRRNVIFVDLALAQIAALGATVAFMLGHAVGSAGSVAYSLCFALAAAALLASTRQWSGRVPQEALIGVIYVVAAAAAFLLVEKAPQGSEHIKQILVGNILLAGMDDLVKVAPIYLLIGGALWMLRSRLAAAGGGVRGWCWDFAFYAGFGVVVTSSVSLAGVLLVFSFLIIPAMIGVIYAHTVGRQLMVGWLAGTVASGVGLAILCVGFAHGRHPGMHVRRGVGSRGPCTAPVARRQRGSTCRGRGARDARRTVHRRRCMVRGSATR